MIDLNLDAEKQHRNGAADPDAELRCYVCNSPIAESSKRLKVHGLERWAMAEEGEPYTVELVGPECWKRVHAIVAERKARGASS